MRFGRWGELLPLRGYSRSPLPAANEAALRGSRWRTAAGVQVISSHVTAELPGAGGQVGPSWHLSVAVLEPGAPGGLRRATEAETLRAVDAFALPAFEEDNHHPGAARHLWCPVEERWRGVCECKLTETVVVEADGYTWTNPTDAPCRGCALARLLPARPCPIHTPGISA